MDFNYSFTLLDYVLIFFVVDEQRGIFKNIMAVVNRQRGVMFFLYGFEGIHKTFMWQTLASALRSKRQIVLTLASSEIASLLLPRGRIGQHIQNSRYLSLL